jgi:hypothetical protein
MYVHMILSYYLSACTYVSYDMPSVLCTYVHGTWYGVLFCTDRMSFAFWWFSRQGYDSHSTSFDATVTCMTNKNKIKTILRSRDDKQLTKS